MADDHLALPFFDRQTEVAALERAWRRRGAGLAVIYGRRRLGKTYIVDGEGLFEP